MAPFRAVLLAASVALLGTASVHAQRSPTATELRAAYCLKVTEAQLAALQAVDRSNPNGQRSVAVETGQAQDRLSRLRLYVDYQMQSLEPTRMNDAMRRGQSDGAQYFGGQLDEKCVGACGASSRIPSDASEETKRCLAGCMNDDDFFSRVASCKDVSWVPR